MNNEKKKKGNGNCNVKQPDQHIYVPIRNCPHCRGALLPVMKSPFDLSLPRNLCKCFQCARQYILDSKGNYVAWPELVPLKSMGNNIHVTEDREVVRKTL